MANGMLDFRWDQLLDPVGAVSPFTQMAGADQRCASAQHHGLTHGCEGKRGFNGSYDVEPTHEATQCSVTYKGQHLSNNFEF